VVQDVNASPSTVLDVIANLSNYQFVVPNG
jgi:hypothetical protein